MKVKMIPSGEVMEFCESYAARLIEQGKAVLAPAKAPKAKEPAAAPVAEDKPKADSKKKG